MIEESMQELDLESNIERKFATVQTIKSIESIEGADAIELAFVLGWQIVVKKGAFKIGDKVVYIEVDSVVPVENEPFTFLKERGGRIRAIKLKGKYSQGLVLSLGECEVPEYTPVGFDLTNFLGITRYQEPLSATKSNPASVKGKFPYHIEKTDEERIERLEYSKYAGKKFFVTEKLDGSSLTFFVSAGKCGVCSRNLELKLEEESAWSTAVKKLGLVERMQKFGVANIVMQGELLGPGIQKNPYHFKDFTVRWFNVILPNSGKLSYDNMCFMLEELKIEGFPRLEPVPFIDTIDLPETIGALQEYANGKSKENPSVKREGIVCRYKDDPSISFKVISPEWAIKN
jgi:RNA ligase (TIGR02306 family)